MRRRISSRKRVAIISVSIIIFIVLTGFVIEKMISYTKSLKEDFSSAQIVCTDINIFSSGEVESFISSADGINVTAEAISELKQNSRDICLVNLEYIVNCNIDEAVNDISFEISSSEISDGKVHAFSNTVMKEKQDNSYHVVQTVLMDKSCLRESFFMKTPPCSFNGQFDYRFSYHVEGREKPNVVAFSTAKKV